MNTWFSIGEVNPGPGVDVIVCDNEGDIFIAWYNEENDSWGSTDERFHIGDDQYLRYWCHLPEHPTENNPIGYSKNVMTVGLN